MANDVQKNLIAAAVTKLAKDVVADESRSSVIQPQEVVSDKISAPSGTGGLRPKLQGVGTGTGVSGAVLSNAPGVFDPTQLASKLSDVKDQGTPQVPRRATASAQTLTGMLNENMAVYLSWCAPLLDTSGRWLQQQSVDATGAAVLSDTIDTYLITRTNTLTQEVVTIAAVAHHGEVISNARVTLETAGKASTHPITLVATIDPSVIVGGEIHLATEEPFTFCDTTALNGQTYYYNIQAISSAQVESAPISVDPGATTLGGTMDITAGGVWATSYPMADKVLESFADITVNVAGIVTDIEVTLIPIQADVLVIDTTADPDTYPLILYMDPAETRLARPTSGSASQLIQFRARNIETNGSVLGITFGAGITAQALPGALTKTQVGTTDDWDYKLAVDVASTTALAPTTMVVTTGNGRSTSSSSILVVDGAVAGGTGATFTRPGHIFRVKSAVLTMTIQGTGMDLINNFAVTDVDGNTVGTATVTKTANTAKPAFTLPQAGTYTLQATYVGRTSNGSDHVSVFYSPTDIGNTETTQPAAMI